MWLIRLEQLGVIPDERMDLSMGLLASFYASSGIGGDVPSCRASWLSAKFGTYEGEEKPHCFLANVVGFLRKGVRFPAIVVRVVAIARSPPRARYAHSEFSFFCLHRTIFSLQSTDGEWFVCEDGAVFSCVKILCNRLFHSVLQVKAKGCALGLLPSPSAPPWQGALRFAFFVVSPTVHFLKSR